MLEIAQVQTAPQIAAAQELLGEYTEWVASLFPDSEHAPIFRGLHEELATLPGIYAPPAGRLLLATLDGQPTGCVCLKPHDASICEMKRLYVRPRFRGRNIGGQLVGRLIEEAQEAGYQRMVLDTHVAMKSAHALYEAVGFRRVGAPEGFPGWLKRVVIFMERDLAAE